MLVLMEDHINISRVNKFGAKWISKPDSYSVVFDKGSFRKAIKFILDNFLKFGSKLIQQVIDIPMAKDQAPLMVNLFLF